MLSLHNLYHSSFKTKLDLAHQLFGEYGKILLSLPLVRANIAVLEQLAQRLRHHMSALNVAPLCAACAGKPGGGCCSLYMADENDAVLFLINLLAGVPVAIQKDDDFECYLLGALGCTLRFKPMFCLNYNCLAIKNHPDTALYSSYLALSGQLLQRQWQLETIILAELMKSGKNRTETRLTD